MKIQVNSNSSDALNELEGLNVLDISLQEGAHIISHKEIKGVDLLKVNIKGNGSFNSYPIKAQNLEITI